MKTALPIVAWVMIALAVLVSFRIDWNNTAQGGAIDFRNRITGARLLVHGIDPYHYKWREADPPEFCDPSDNPNRPVSRTTITPALLSLYPPLAELPYRVAQFVWLGLQWALLLGTGVLWWQACRAPTLRWLVVVAVVGFSFTAAWRLHAERGQCYVPLTFFLAWWLTATLDPARGNGFLAGCIAGFLATLRPPFLLLFPFLALHRRGQLVGAAVGAAVGFVVPMLMLPACWLQFLRAIETFSDLYRSGFHPPHGDLAYPPTIEGMPLSLIKHSLYLPDGLFSVHTFLFRAHLEPFPALPPLLALAAIFAVWLWRSRRSPVESLLPGMAAWIFLADLFLPILRESYDDVLILNVVAAGLAIASRPPWATWPCLLALPIGGAVYLLNLDHPWVVMPSALFTFGAILALYPSESRAITIAPATRASSPASGTPGTPPRAAASG